MEELQERLEELRGYLVRAGGSIVAATVTMDKIEALAGETPPEPLPDPPPDEEPAELDPARW